MENNHKRILLNMAYYTLFGLGVLFSVLFFLRTIYSNVPTYIKIIYYIWTALLVGNLVFDVVCTRRHEMKYICGIAYFVLTLLCVVMAIDVFFTKGVSLQAITSIEFTYFIDTILSFIPVTLGIYAYLFGEKLINFYD